MAFPANPTNGQIYGSKKYNSTKGSWEEVLDYSTIRTDGSRVLQHQFQTMGSYTFLVLYQKLILLLEVFIL